MYTIYYIYYIVYRIQYIVYILYTARDYDIIITSIIARALESDF